MYIKMGSPLEALFAQLQNGAWLQALRTLCVVLGLWVCGSSVQRVTASSLQVLGFCCARRQSTISGFGGKDTGGWGIR